MVMANHPAPPGDVLEGIANVCVLEVEECADVALLIDDDIDRGKVAMDEDGVEPPPAQDGLSELQGVTGRQVEPRSIDVPQRYQLAGCGSIDLQQLSPRAGHGARQRSSPCPGIEPVGADATIHAVGDQPGRVADRDDLRVRYREPRSRGRSHVRRQASRVVPPARSEPTCDQVAAVGEAQPPRRLRVTPGHSRRLVEGGAEMRCDRKVLGVHGQVLRFHRNLMTSAGGGAR